MSIVQQSTSPNSSHSLKKEFFEILFLILLPLLYLSVDVIVDTDKVIGRETRDLYDHLALLDMWKIHVQEWNHPTGGLLVPPDLFSMFFAYPFLSLGHGVAFDISLWIQLSLCAVSGYQVGKRVGSGLVGGLVFGFSPFLLGQLLGGETETLNAWPLGFALAAYFLARSFRRKRRYQGTKPAANSSVVPLRSSCKKKGALIKTSPPVHAPTGFAPSKNESARTPIAPVTIKTTTQRL